LVVHPHDAQAAASLRQPRAQLEEAVQLAQAIELEIAEAIVFTLKKATPRTLIGSGQVAHCRELAQQHTLDVIIINGSLSPTQQRNLEKATACKIIDRTALILEIFGARARTNEGRLQVELAALEYQKSRLVRSWTHLERQRGGFGFLGGPGESQIETDRRLIAERISAIKQQLEKVVRTRSLHRKTRRETPLPVVALVGYTNAGKSTLFNRLTRAKVLAEDMLFATLDPTLRALRLPSGQRVILSDTVGFISDLPHQLVAAFRATLEEVLEADLLLHVRDCVHPDSQAQARDVAQVLRTLLPEDAMPPLLEVWNKSDAITPETHLHPPEEGQPICMVSALTGDGLESLTTMIDSMLQQHHSVQRAYELDAGNGKALAWLHAHGVVQSQEASDEARLRVKVQLRAPDAARFEALFMAQPHKP
jgi:GTPase